MDSYLGPIVDFVKEKRIRAVMVRISHLAGYKCRHLRVYFAADGEPYVIMGRRAARQRKYLKNMRHAHMVLETPLFEE